MRKTKKQLKAQEEERKKREAAESEAAQEKIAAEAEKKEAAAKEDKVIASGKRHRDADVHSHDEPKSKRTKTGDAATKTAKSKKTVAADPKGNAPKTRVTEGKGPTILYPGGWALLIF